MVVVTVFGRFRCALGVRHPQPGSRRGTRNAARTNSLEAGEDGAILALAGSGRGSRRDVELSGSVSWFAEDQSEAGRRVELPVIPFAAAERHEAVRLGQDGINQGSDHATTGWES